MDSFIKELLRSRGIEYCGAVPMDDSLIINRGLYDRTVKDFARNVVVFITPYRAEYKGKRNISLYSVPRDYHLYMKELFADIVPILENRYPGARFKGMSDHSPINETLVAAKCGLGVIGDNTRLINEKYGSYVFIGEIYTDADISVDAPSEPGECLHCGKCEKSCPAEFGKTCLSEITQKKSELTPDEAEMIKRLKSAWGCDRCQEVCPMNEGKADTCIRFFKTDLMYVLDKKTLEKMTDEEFVQRAFSWRGRGVISRNLDIIYDKQDPLT